MCQVPQSTQHQGNSFELLSCMGMRGSSSVPTLPPPGRPPPRPPVRPGSSGRPSTAELVQKLSAENAALREAVEREKKAFGATFLKDMKAPARRRMDPMRKLLSEQAETTSDLVTSAMEKHTQLSLILKRVTEDATVQNRRQQDVGQLQLRLEALEDELLEADADAAEACDREATYTMMDSRLRDLVSDDQARINKIQRVIDESRLRLNQWHAVSKEGETELANAEAELAALRTKLKSERQTQRKMMNERRTTVESMVKYTKDRVARADEHRDRLMASRGDLDAEGEEKLRVAAGTMEALRAMDSGSKVQLSFEDKCRAAFDQIRQLSGAVDLGEVLYIITSKKELTDQLQKRVHSTEQRIARLTEERDAAEAQAAEEQYGITTDSKAKVALEEARLSMGIATTRHQEASKQLGAAMHLLQSSRLAWENLLHLLEPGKAPGYLTRGFDQLAGGGGAAGTPSVEGGSMAEEASSSLPVELVELPSMLEEVSSRAERLLQLTERQEHHPALAGVSSHQDVPASTARAGDEATPHASATSLVQTKRASSKGAAQNDADRSGSRALNHNIRIQPPEMVEELLSRGDVVDDPSRRTPGSRVSGRGGEAIQFRQEEDDDLLSREDLKAVSSRISRKAQRRRPDSKEAKKR